MSWAHKYRVTAVFVVGFLACIASVVRLVYSVKLFRVSAMNTTDQLQLDIDKEGLWAYAVQFPHLTLSLLMSA